MDGAVRLSLGEQTVDGVGADVSGAGILFHTDAPLRVEVEWTQDGEVMRRSGTLVRSQRKDTARWGIAVEFDRDPD